MSEIKDLIQNALDQDYNKASEVFGEIMSVKMSDLLDQEKIKLAGQIYNGQDLEDEDAVAADLSDEEIDAADVDLDLEGEDDESEEDEVSEEEEDETSDDDKE